MREGSPTVSGPPHSLGDRLAHASPARLAVAAFSLVVLVVAVLLCLPLARAGAYSPGIVDAIFTATSAVCVTGLTTVPTAEYWSGFGQVVIVAGMQIGGLGVMTLGSLLSLAASRRLGLRSKVLTASETGTSRLGEVGILVRAVAIISLAAELLLMAVLTPKFMMAGESLGTALWHGLFYGVSAFNNAGFVPTEAGLEAFASDWWVLAPIMTAVFVGSLGFPVILDLTRHWRHPSALSLHSKLTISCCLVLLGFSWVAFTAIEWNNPGTVGPLSAGATVLNTLFAGVMTRSGGFATVDISQQHPATTLLQDALMFVGGGSASTAGGIKVTTLAVMLLAIRAEARGDRDMEAFGRRIEPSILRVAVTVAVASVMFVFTGALILSLICDAPLAAILFECVSAFATCGLSTGLATTLPPLGKLTLAALMLTGRLGTMTIATSVAMTNRRRVIRLPEDRPIVG
ncbi:MAG: TrkH family potassium uptake protein [Bifidobacteriaceae bacterium]|jgi:Trk-type K+ transport system membrane component|nr:TrkH family potassium uptake protein [Bifidobacteriaceae bacterium]